MYRQNKFFSFLAAVVVLLNSISTSVSAQDTLGNLTLKEAISATVANNSAIKLAIFDEDIAASEYKQTGAVYLPQLGFSFAGMTTNNPLNAFGFKLEQKSVTQNDFNPGLLNDPSATSDFTTKLEVKQPIINMDLWYKRKAADKQVELYHYKTERTKEYLTFEATKTYMQLQLAYDAVKVLDEALQTTQSVYTFTNNHFQQGLVQKSDVLNAEVRLATVKSNLSNAKSNVSKVSDQLSLLMGKPAGHIYKVSALLAQTSETDTATKIAASRADFMAMQKAIEATDLMIKSNRMSYLPKLNAFGSYQLNDRRLLGFGANAYLAGVQLTWNIFSGNSIKNTIHTQALQRDKMAEQLTDQKDQSQLELNKTYRDLADAQNDIQQQKIAVDQASEALHIIQNRYQQGLVNTTDVLMAATQLSQQQFNLSQAVFTSNVTRAYIQLLTSSTNQ
jgi:outer membrane protein TolC